MSYLLVIPNKTYILYNGAVIVFVCFTLSEEVSAGPGLAHLLFSSPFRLGGLQGFNVNVFLGEAG